MQGIGRHRHLGHRHCTVPGDPKIESSRTGFPDQSTDPGKERIVGPALEDRTGAQA